MEFRFSEPNSLSQRALLPNRFYDELGGYVRWRLSPEESSVILTTVGHRLLRLAGDSGRGCDANPSLAGPLI